MLITLLGMEWSDRDPQYSFDFVLSIHTYHCNCGNAPLLNSQSLLSVAIFYPPEFLGTAHRLIAVEFIPYSSDEPSAITISAVFDTLAQSVVSVVFVVTSVSHRSQTLGHIPPTMIKVSCKGGSLTQHPSIAITCFIQNENSATRTHQ